MKKKSIGSAMAMFLAAGMLYDHVPWYRRIWKKGRSKRKGSWISGVKPHQGERECARRLRQIEQGIIPKEQCL